MVLRALITNWVRSEATRRASDALSESLSGSEQQAGDDKQAQQPLPPCEVAVICALSAEAGGIVDTMKGLVAIEGDGFLVRQGLLGKRRVAVVESGPGCERAARATAALIAAHRPQWVISAGFAGGLVDGIKRRDLVVADSVADESGERLAIDIKLDTSGNRHRHVGRLLTLDRIVRSPQEKRSLGEKHKAAAVDMETFAVAEVCRHERVRFFAVRGISDGVDDEVPPEVENLLQQTNNAARAGAVAGALFRRPSSMKDIWRMREDALIASDHIAQFLGEIAAHLPVSEAKPEEGDSGEADTAQGDN